MGKANSFSGIKSRVNCRRHIYQELFLAIKYLKCLNDNKKFNLKIIKVQPFNINGCKIDDLGYAVL